MASGANSSSPLGFRVKLRVRVGVRVRVRVLTHPAFWGSQ